MGMYRIEKCIAGVIFGLFVLIGLSAFYHSHNTHECKMQALEHNMKAEDIVSLCGSGN